MAAFTKDDIEFNILTPAEDHRTYETLWIQSSFKFRTFIYVLVYHPPKPIYDVSSFKIFFCSNINTYSNIHPNCSLLLAGDFNQ